MEIYKKGKVLSFDEIKESLISDNAHAQMEMPEQNENQILNNLIYIVIDVDNSEDKVLLKDEHNNKYLLLADELDRTDTEYIINDLIPQSKVNNDESIEVIDSDAQDLTVRNILNNPRAIEIFLSEKYPNVAQIPTGSDELHNGTTFMKISPDMMNYLTDLSFYNKIII